MADFSQNKKYNYNWQSSKFKNLALSGSYISQFINDAGYVTSSVAISASYALTASYLLGTIASASYATSASYALTASYVINALSASYAETASFSLATTENRILVLNQSGNTIAKGVVVHITASGNSSDVPRIITASYLSDNTSANTLGITSQAITNGSQGYVTTEGVITGINTNAFQSGQLVYLGATGSITGSAPLAPFHSVRLGQVIREQSNNGSIYVRIDNGYELGELHDVQDFTTTSSYGDLLVKSGSVWTNSKQLTGSYGLTGSLTATSFTGSLLGTSSYATQALSASYAPVTPPFPYTGSALITGSLGVTGSLSTFAQSNLSTYNALAVRYSANDRDLFLLNGLGRARFGFDSTGTDFITIDPQNSTISMTAYGGLTLMSLTNSQGYFGYGVAAYKLGIGTNSPGARLDVRAQGALSTDIAFRVRNSADNDNIFSVKGNRNIFLLGETNNGRIELSSNGGSAIMKHRATAVLPSTFIVGSYGDGGSVGQITLDAFIGDGTTPTFTTQRLISGLSDLSGSALYSGFGTNAATFVMKNALNYVGYGVIPTGTATDHFAMYSADINGVNGTASPNFRTEDGSILWLGTQSKLFNVTASNLILSGSATIGFTSSISTENTLTLGPPPAGGTGEGGQLGLAASGGLYTSASMIDTWQNQFRILRGTNAGSNAGLMYMDLQTGNTQFVGAVTASGGYSNLPNDYLYVTRNTTQTIGSGTWADRDIIFNNSVVSKGISYNTGTGLASLTAGKVYRITSRLAWSAAAAYLLEFSCYDSSNTQLGPTTQIVQSTNGSNNISDGTLDFIYAPGSNVDIKIRTTANTTALTGESIRGDLNTQLIIQQIA